MIVLAVSGMFSSRQKALARSIGPVVLLLVVNLRAQPAPVYVGVRACISCHATAGQRLAGSFHSKILRPATKQSVQGDFAQTKLVLRGSTYLLHRRNGRYYVTQSEEGKPSEHRVEYTVGARRIQQYLTTLSDGRMLILAPTWDVVGKRWLDNTDDDNPEEDSGAKVQIWNKSCYSCHVSEGKKNFDVQHLQYHTTWRDFGVGCEHCHGPGSNHVMAARQNKLLDPQTRAQLVSKIVRPERLDATRSTMVCAQCHSFRDIYVDGFSAGWNYYDFFLPVMEYRLPSSPASAYWPDGRPRWLANEALALWQSQCFLKGGASCLTCHSQPHDINVAHDRQLRPRADELCARCHSSIVADIRGHTHHTSGSPGSSCIECHMPATVLSLNTGMRDHSLSVPVPENTIQHGIPNACNLCHRDKNAEWASRQVSAWYGNPSGRRYLRRADAFTGARQGNSLAIPELLEILSDSSEGGLVRANAVGYLGTFPNDPSAYDAVARALADSQPLVRATAVLAIRPRAAQRAALAPLLTTMLGDPVQTVRMTAAIALIGMGVAQLPGDDELRLEGAKNLYRDRAQLDADDAQQQFAAGKFFFLAGDMDSAVAAFRASLKLNPDIAAPYYLGRALAQKGELQAARQILETIPPNDLQYRAAQQLLTDLEAHNNEAAGRGIGHDRPGEADADFRDGRILYQNKDYGGALKQLDEALRLAPQATWATRAKTYRAICLERLGHTSEAETAMEALPAETIAHDMDLQLAWAELLYDTGRLEEARQRIDRLIATAGNAPMAYFWRAKVLLQLGRTEEAAKAAEESIRLQADLPVTHNLLMRIYQIQGRTQDAAEQAQWLRQYQRRMESR